MVEVRGAPATSLETLRIWVRGGDHRCSGPAHLLGFRGSGVARLRTSTTGGGSGLGVSAEYSRHRHGRRHQHHPGGDEERPRAVTRRRIRVSSPVVWADVAGAVAVEPREVEDQARDPARDRDCRDSRGGPGRARRATVSSTPASRKTIPTVSRAATPKPSSAPTTPHHTYAHHGGVRATGRQTSPRGAHAWSMRPMAPSRWRRAPRPCLGFPVTRAVEADYLVVGAGATGMAFTDALIDHADVRVALVDRREGVGGHWLEAYPFVRLHQSSTFYGVASTLLGGGRIQEHGPEAGLHERADQPTICAYYDDLLANRHARRRAGSSSSPAATTSADRTLRLARLGRAVRGAGAAAGSSMPATSRPTSRRRRRRGSRSADGARVIPVNDLVRVEDDAEPVRDRGLRQDRDRRLRLAARRVAWTPTRSAGCGRATRGC